MKKSLALSLSTLAGAGSLLAVSPVLNGTYPAGGQRGTELEVEFRGARLEDFQQVLFYTPGFEVVKVNSTNASSVKAIVKVAPTVMPGEHTLRLRTATGVSELRTFYVSPFTQVNEVDKPANDTKETAEKIAANVTINGTVSREDDDWFALEAKKGQRIGVEVEGMRLGRDLFDPIVTIFKADGTKLAAADDTALFLQDPALTVIAPEDGTYYIRIEEAPYERSRNAMYRLHVGNFPRPLAVYPAGGKAGEKLTVTFIGDATGEFKQEVTLPGAKDAKFPVLASHNNLNAPSPNWLRVSDFPNVLEAEPNNERAKASGATQEAPVAFNGIINQNGDEDWFRFTAKKGQVWEVNVYAQGIRSPLDAVLNVYDKDGRGLANNDDSGSPDSYLRFTVPADGEFFIRVTDHLGRGGPNFVYRAELAPVLQTLTYSIPEVNRDDSQGRQAMVVPKGNRFMTMMSIRRNNFGGEVIFDPKDLPPGVKVDVDNIPGNLTSIPVVFEAAPDAPIGSKFVDLQGRLVEKDKDGNQTDRTIPGGLDQKLNLVLGRPNNTIYYSTYADKLVVAVAEEAPFKIDIIEPKVPLVREGSMELKIVATRKEGFDEPITVYLPFRPPGMGANSSATIGKGQKETTYTINANGNAETKVWRFPALASATVKGAPLWTSSQMAKIEIGMPYVGLKFDLATAEQGQDSKVVCKLEQKLPFEGKAKLKLMGLPNKVTTQEIEITKDMSEAVFPIKVDATSPVGMHRNLYCALIIEKNGEAITHNFGARGSLRIAAPEKRTAEAPAPAKTAAVKK